MICAHVTHGTFILAMSLHTIFFLGGNKSTLEERNIYMEINQTVFLVFKNSDNQKDTLDSEILHL